MEKLPGFQKEFSFKFFLALSSLEKFTGWLFFFFSFRWLLEHKMNFSSFWVYHHLRFMRMCYFGNISYNQDYGTLFTSLDLIFFWFSEMMHLPEVRLWRPLSDMDHRLIKDASSYLNDSTSSVYSLAQICQESLSFLLLLVQCNVLFLYYSVIILIL